MNTVKWIGVLPVAILGNFIGIMLSRVIWWFSSSYMMMDIHWYNWMQEHVISHVVGGAFFIIAGVWLAPKSKKKTAQVLFAVYMILSLGALYVNYNLQEGFYSIIEVIAAAIGCGVGWYYVDEEAIDSTVYH